MTLINRLWNSPVFVRSADIHQAKRRTLQIKQTCTKSISLLFRTLKILAITVFFDIVPLVSASGSMVECSGGGQRLNVFRVPPEQLMVWTVWIVRIRCSVSPASVCSPHHTGRKAVKFRGGQWGLKLAYVSFPSQVVPKRRLRCCGYYVEIVLASSKNRPVFLSNAVAGNYCILSGRIVPKDADAESLFPCSVYTNSLQLPCLSPADCSSQKRFPHRIDVLHLLTRFHSDSGKHPGTLAYVEWHQKALLIWVKKYY